MDSFFYEGSFFFDQEYLVNVFEGCQFIGDMCFQGSDCFCYFVLNFVNFIGIVDYMLQILMIIVVVDDSVSDEGVGFVVCCMQCVCSCVGDL